MLESISIVLTCHSHVLIPDSMDADLIQSEEWGEDHPLFVG